MKFDKLCRGLLHVAAFGGIVSGLTLALRLFRPNIGFWEGVAATFMGAVIFILLEDRK
jgi:hypothetical protein